MFFARRSVAWYPTIKAASPLIVASLDPSSIALFDERNYSCVLFPNIA